VGNAPGEYLIGPSAAGPFRASFRRHPHHAYSLASGRGKSTLLQHVTAQLLAQHPDNKAVCVDIKGVSLAPVRDMPGLELVDDPSDVGAMAAALQRAHDEMMRRYQQLRANPGAEFSLLLVLLEEVNAFAEAVAAWWRKLGHKDAPPLWAEVVAYLLQQGRQVSVHMIGVFQDFLDNQFGGISLRPLFELIGMSGWKSQQWDRIIGTKPVPRPQPGPGRILMCDGDTHTWVQALYAKPEELISFVRKARDGA
jgi:FtsK/SpoIIIE family